MFRIDERAAAAPYQQICDQVAAQVQSGELAVGARLPTVRGLAADLGIAPGTVAKAYTELERAGLIEARGRAGTRVSANGDAARTVVREAAAAYADRVGRLGLSTDELVAAVRAALEG